MTRRFHSKTQTNLEASEFENWAPYPRPVQLRRHSSEPIKLSEELEAASRSYVRHFSDKTPSRASSQPVPESGASQAGARSQIDDVIPVLPDQRAQDESIAENLRKELEQVMHTRQGPHSQHLSSGSRNPQVGGSCPTSSPCRSVSETDSSCMPTRESSFQPQVETGAPNDTGILSSTDVSFRPVVQTGTEVWPEESRQTNNSESDSEFIAHPENLRALRGLAVISQQLEAPLNPVHVLLLMFRPSDVDDVQRLERGIRVVLFWLLQNKTAYIEQLKSEAFQYSESTYRDVVIFCANRLNPQDLSTKNESGDSVLSLSERAGLVKATGAIKLRISQARGKARAGAAGSVSGRDTEFSERSTIDILEGAATQTSTDSSHAPPTEMRNPSPSKTERSGASTIPISGPTSSVPQTTQRGPPRTEYIDENGWLIYKGKHKRIIQALGAFNRDLGAKWTFNSAKSAKMLLSFDPLSSNSDPATADFPSKIRSILMGLLRKKKQYMYNLSPQTGFAQPEPTYSDVLVFLIERLTVEDLRMPDANGDSVLSLAERGEF